MYDIQITSYDANLSFFMDEFIIYVIIQSIKALEKKLHTSGQQVGMESIKNLIYEALLLSCGQGCQNRDPT